VDIDPQEAGAAPGNPLILHWRSLSDGLLVAFIVAGPSLFGAFILRDQRSHKWVLLAFVSIIGFFLGGLIAGRHRRRAKGAIYQGIALALLVTVTIVLSDVVRHLVLARGVNARVLSTWIGALVGSMVVASIGGILGRLRFRRSRRKKQFGG
jgi:membrane protein YqaA with SNARE-associated domain